MSASKIYYFIRIVTLPLSYLPYSLLRWIGKGLGLLAYYLLTDYRKRALSNLAIAGVQQDLFKIAKESFQNLAILCLEFPKLAKEKNLSRIVTCENPEMADQIYKEKKGLIFFCAHQSNWELLFLDGTKRMNGLAIAKPIKNKQLYRWILTIRERFGGKIVPPTQAIKESLRALKKGWFVGIVGDEALPDSGYCYPLFHQKTYVSSAPALLSYKTGCPMIFAWTQRKKKGYTIRYSAPTYPDLNKPMDVEVPKMMDVMMQHLEKSVQNSMGEWFWQHNRWKRQSIRILYRRYRQDSICIILPLNPSLFEHIPTFLSIYPSDQMTVFLPKATSLSLEKSTLCHYETLDEVYVLDYRFRLVFDFTNTPSIRKHFLRLSAKYVFHIPDLYAAAQEHLKPHHSLSDVIQRALCKPHTIWNNNRPLA